MNQRGFSLLETVTAIMLAGIIGSVAVGSIKMVEQVQFECKVNEVVNGIESMKEAAAATGRQYNFYCFKNRMLLRRGIDCIGKIYLGSRMEIPTDITGRWIKFRGTIAPHRAGTIIINDKWLGMRARITVGVGTGKVRVYYEKI